MKKVSALEGIYRDCYWERMPHRGYYIAKTENGGIVSDTKKGLFQAIDESKRFKEGERVRISGEVKYGDSFYRVATDGLVVADTKKKSRSTLVLVDCIDGDGGVTCFIENKYISRWINHNKNEEG